MGRLLIPYVETPWVSSRLSRKVPERFDYYIFVPYTAFAFKKGL